MVDMMTLVSLGGSNSGEIETIQGQGYGISTRKIENSYIPRVKKK